MYPRFLPSHRRRYSKQGFLGSHASSRLLNQEKSHCPTEGHSLQPCANQSRRMLTLFRLRYRARIQPNRFFLQKEEVELAMRPIHPRNISMRGGCAQTHAIPRVQLRPNTFQSGLSHIFGTMPEPSRPQDIEIDAFHDMPRTKGQP